MVSTLRDSKHNYLIGISPSDKPNTTVLLRRNGLVEGENVILTCEADGCPDVAPSAVYEWKMDDKVIENENKKAYIIRTLDIMLHDGEYTCSVANFLGTKGHGQPGSLRVYCKF